jgi:HSP20 family protein
MEQAKAEQVVPPPNPSHLARRDKMNSGSREPYRDIEQMLRGLGRPQTHATPHGSGHEVMTSADWTPLVDISETPDEYLIKVELPEVDKNDVKVSLDGGVVLIRGERRLAEEDGRRFHRVERPYGTFARSFSLPENVEEDQIKAEHRAGMLYVYLPKHREPKPKSIEIKIA